MSRPVARPTGTVTFLFTDIEESSRQWEADAPATETLVEAHDKLVRTVVDGHDGYVFTTMGDGFAVAFQRASEAVAAAVELQETLVGEEWVSSGLRLRMGLHTGEAAERDGDYFGPTVNRAARIMGLAHGGQILLSAVTAAIVPEFETVELGEYQLRGLTRPERLHQLVKTGLERDFPALRGDPGTAHNLSAELTSFVGRQAEIEDLAVRVHEARLITLVGPGGAGKTRLATETARRLLDEFPNGVWLAELAVLRDPGQVAVTVAKAMGHHDPLAEAGGPGLVRDRLAAAIGPHRVLLVLDNCEHVLGAAADLVATLLGRCPRLVVVATSRQSLGVGGERLVEVGSLDLPAGNGVAEVAGSAAGALFVERAQSVHPRFQLDPPAAAGVAEVCRRLDGLPLAIELAAARSRLLTPVQIAERLEETLALPAPGHGGADRHHTMRAALVWSYDLLSEDEQVLFRRLAVFRSSFILEAAAAVAPEQSGDILSVLGGLVDKSLVEVVDDPRGERRFRLLEPARQFAAELLQSSGERDDAAGRLGDHLLARLPTRGNITPGSAAYESLAIELDNLRAAVEYSLRASQLEAALRLINSYLLWWRDLGLLDEQLDRLDAALRSADRERVSLGVVANALSTASYTATYLGRVEEAAAFVEQLAELKDEHPEDLAVRAGWALALGILTWFRSGGERSEGNRLMDVAQQAWEARDRLISAAYPPGVIPLAAILWDAADDPEVARATTEATRLARTSGDQNVAVLVRVFDGVIRVLGGAGDAYPTCLDDFVELDALDGGWLAELAGLTVAAAAELVGDQPVATAHELRWVRFCRRSGMRFLLTCGIRGAARMSASAGHAEQALGLWGCAEQIEAASGLRYMPLMQRLDRPLRQPCADALGADAIRLLAEGASWSVAEASQAAEQALLGLQAGNRREAIVVPVDPVAE
jgi:predicted ATPase/class 3 adenylate cyclase